MNKWAILPFFLFFSYTSLISSFPSPICGVAAMAGSRGSMALCLWMFTQGSRPQIDQAVISLLKIALFALHYLTEPDTAAAWSISDGGGRGGVAKLMSWRRRSCLHGPPVFFFLSSTPPQSQIVEKGTEQQRKQMTDKAINYPSPLPPWCHYRERTLIGPWAG